MFYCRWAGVLADLVVRGWEGDKESLFQIVWVAVGPTGPEEEGVERWLRSKRD